MERDLRGRADAHGPSAVRFEQVAEEPLRRAAVPVDLPFEFAHGVRLGGPAGIRVDDGDCAELRARRADGLRPEHPHELLRVLDVQHGLEEERLEDLQAAGRRAPVSLPLHVVELAGPDHRLADGHEQPMCGVELADVVVDPGEESLVEFVPESADGAGA